MWSMTTVATLPRSKSAAPAWSRGGDRLPQQPPRDVAPALVRGDDALAEDEGRSPDVVGDDPDVPLPRASPGEARLHGTDDRSEEVRLVRRVAALQDHGHALQAGTGVHAGEPHRLEEVAGGPVELQEHAGGPDPDVPAPRVQ